MIFAKFLNFSPIKPNFDYKTFFQTISIYSTWLHTSHQTLKSDEIATEIQRDQIIHPFTAKFSIRLTDESWRTEEKIFNIPIRLQKTTRRARNLSLSLRSCTEKKAKNVSFSTAKSFLTFSLSRSLFNMNRWYPFPSIARCMPID